MNYFHNRSKYVSPSGFRQDLKLMLLAVKSAFERASHLIKGRKRLYASSLAFKTALALVPAVAILMAVLAGDNFTQKRELILDRVVDLIYPVENGTAGDAFGPPEPQDLRRLKEVGRQKIHLAVKRFAQHAEKMGLAGLAAFAIVLFLLLRDVEDSFNFLWGVEKSRHFLAQVFLYTALLLGAPLVAVLGLTVQGWMESWGLLKTLLAGRSLTSFMLFLGLWIFCSWIYKWVPNIKVRWKPAAWGGLLAALLLEGARWGMNWYTLHAVQASKIYGTLWMFPVVLLWFYMSWTVILFGAEVAFFTQRGRDEARR